MSIYYYIRSWVFKLFPPSQEDVIELHKSPDKILEEIEQEELDNDAKEDIIEEEENELITANPIEEYLTSISFCVKQDGTLSIFYSWQDDSDAVVQLSADLIERINRGDLERSIYEVLLQYGAFDVRHAHLVSKIFEALGNAKEVPVIDPTEVLRNISKS